MPSFERLRGASSRLAPHLLGLSRLEPSTNGRPACGLVLAPLPGRAFLPLFCRTDPWVDGLDGSSQAPKVFH